VGSRGPYSNSRIHLTWRIIIMGPNNTKTLLQLTSFPPPGPTTPPHLTLVMKTFQMIFLHLAPCKITLSSARHRRPHRVQCRMRDGQLVPLPHHRRETQCGAPSSSVAQVVLVVEVAR